jgi:hypothetical protein
MPSSPRTCLEKFLVRTFILLQQHRSAHFVFDCLHLLIADTVVSSILVEVDSQSSVCLVVKCYAVLKKLLPAFEGVEVAITHHFEELTGLLAESVSS